MEEYQGNGKCPRCGKTAYRETAPIGDLGSSFTPTVQGPMVCTNQECGWYEEQK
jgi:hypothetical protein